MIEERKRRSREKICPALKMELDSYKGCIPVDVALQIVREEILGE